MNANNQHTLMQFLRFTAVPKSDNPEANEFGGAIVNVWIKELSLADAPNVAAIMIEDDGWIPTKLEEHYEVSSEDLKESPEAKNCFDRTVIEGRVMEFHTYPKGATE